MNLKTYKDSKYKKRFLKDTKSCLSSVQKRVAAAARNFVDVRKMKRKSLRKLRGLIELISIAFDFFVAQLLTEK